MHFIFHQGHALPSPATSGKYVLLSNLMLSNRGAPYETQHLIMLHLVNEVELRINLVKSHKMKVCKKFYERSSNSGKLSIV